MPPNKRLQPTRSAAVASLLPLRVRLNRRPLYAIGQEIIGGGQANVGKSYVLGLIIVLGSEFILRNVFL
ncbi:MAG: hypothetical protein DRG83_17190, partial [Deltaproteobacteria bacterium]